MKSKQLVIEKLAAGIINLDSITFPENIIKIAKKLIVDVSGVTLAGSCTRSVQSILDVASEIYSSGNCNVIGRKKSFNPAGAALINGASAHSLDFDDNCYAGIVHSSAVVFPAVLAFAQYKALSGQDLLKSFIIGLEIEFAVAKALSNNIYDKGWWTTSVLGSVGSTAGVASLAKINIKEIGNALSLAISGVGAIRAVRGTNAKHYYCGRAAENGIVSNSLAMKGSKGPLDVFEDRNGIISILNEKAFEHTYIDNIGKEFGLLNPGVDIKKYPVCYASHAAADGVKSIIESKNIAIENIDKIICTVPPIIASNLTFHKPKTVKEAQFSLEFSIAMIIKYGDIKLEHLSSDYIMNLDIQNLINKVKMSVDKLPKKFKLSDKICPEWSKIELFTRSGERHEEFVGAPLGSSLNPMSEDMLY
ncbi:MAG: MmgE/PrpD family protein, partial [Pseudomonadota bacterium]|nr:MmgE/PrpD family protein [Pseudomonadota bacterium]